jgi:hypothetical protein
MQNTSHYGNGTREIHEWTNQVRGGGGYKSGTKSIG